MSNEHTRDTVTSISASHLGGTVKDDENEGWGELPAPKAKTPVQVTPPMPASTQIKRLDDDDLENELAGNVANPAKNETLEEIVAPKAPEVSSQETDVLQQIDQIQTNLPSVIATLEKKIESIEEQRKALIEEEKSIKSRINFLRVMNGQPPLEGAEETKPRRRGGRRPAPLDAASLTATIQPRTDAEEEIPVAEGEDRPKGRGGRGKRYKNPLTLKQAICKALFNMSHPTTHQKYTGTVNDVTIKVMTKVEEGGYGYRSTAGSKQTNTVRIQMHRLHDAKLLVQNEDGSYTLCEDLVKKLVEASAAPAAE